MAGMGARQAGPRWRKMPPRPPRDCGLKAHGRDNGGALSGHLQQEVERLVTSPIALTATRVERGRVELLVPERTRAIMRTFYVIETEGSAAQRHSNQRVARRFLLAQQPRPVSRFITHAAHPCKAGTP